MSQKKKTLFVCQNCGSKSHKWLGKCLDCGEYNTLVEEMAESAVSTKGTGFSKDEAAHEKRPI